MRNNIRIAFNKEPLGIIPLGLLVVIIIFNSFETFRLNIDRSVYVICVLSLLLNLIVSHYLSFIRIGENKNICIFNISSSFNYRLYALLCLLIGVLIVSIVEMWIKPSHGYGLLLIIYSLILLCILVSRIFRRHVIKIEAPQSVSWFNYKGNSYFLVKSEKEIIFFNCLSSDVSKISKALALPYVNRYDLDLNSIKNFLRQKNGKIIVEQQIA